MNVDVISKATGTVSQVSTDTINLGGPSIVRLDIARADVAGFERQGQDLVVRLANGEQVRVVDFYLDNAAIPHDLVLREPDGTQWLARTTNTPARYSLIEDLDDLTTASGGGSSLALPAILAGVAGAAGLAAVAAGGGGDDDRSDQPNPGPGTGVTPDTTPPTTPTATVRGDGAVLSGTGEAGATIQVRDASGAVIGTGVVGADGTYSVTLTAPQIKGDPIVVTQTDPAGNVSGGTTVATPDLTAPAAPSATVDATGTIITGRGEPGATVTVTNAAGVVIGTAVVAADGTYTVTLAVPSVDGAPVSVVQTDAAGNVSAPVSAATPDLTAPTAPTATIADDGAQITGRGEPGATVTVRDATGVVIATVIVAPDGSYTATLVPAQVDGTTVSVVQTDPAGNVSPSVDLGTPDLTAPAPPTITIDASGTQVSGTGEPGAQVVITDPAGATLATVTVAADGSYSAILSAPQVDGEVIEARQTDAAGNASGTASTIAPDFTAPAQPTATISADGTSVAGTGEPGARIVFADATGAVIATATVAADGSYSAALTPAQANGEQLTATQFDAAGNAAPPLSLVAPDVTAPPAPVATLDASGTIVSGSGEPGASVTVRGVDGTVLGTGTVDAQGNYAIPLGAVQGNGETLSVTQADSAGNTSPASTLVAPDLTAPLAPTGIVGGDGTSISGSGEAGATVTIRSPVGAVIATAVVGADGTYSAALTPAQVDGEVLTVRQADAAGNVSPIATAIAPDLVPDDAPDAPTATVVADGTAITGVAVAGAAIIVYDADGTIVGTGVAAADGSYTVALAPPRIDGETIGVTQSDADGDVSPPAFAVAPDLTAPEAPVATLDPTGAVVTGSAEAGAAITVRAADGTVLGTATANPRGDFAITLDPIQDAGGTVLVTQADAAGNVSPPASLAAPDFVAPDAPSASVAPDGSAVAGAGEAGAVVTVRDAGGAVIGSAVVAADGTYSVPLAPPQANGETVSVTLTDAAGNVSTPVDALAPDITAPGTPTATLSDDGGLIAGTGEPGAIVTVTAPGGAVIGSAAVGAGGSYVVTLDTPQTNGETLSVAQADAAGNTSAPASVVAADVTAPAAPAVVVNDDGTAVTGTGEPGATVTITDPAGAVIGMALIEAGGTYTALLSPAQVNGETLSATQADAAGNVSGIATAVAPDFTVPAQVDATINGDGTAVSGTGEAGARIVIVDAAGATIGTTIVAADGSFEVILTPAQANGEALSVVQSDPAGNVSPPLALTAPDITAPPAPNAVLDPSGTIVTGTGEAGATVSVRDAGGAELGTTVVDERGVYTVVLATPQIDSQSLDVVQTDPAGNTSVPTQLIASDLTAPAAPAATVGEDGLSVTGTGEVGAAIVIRDPLGAVIGNATVAPDGTYTATLSSAQVDGEVLAVRQIDAAGNISLPATATAPDLVADTDPDAPSAAVGVDGATVTGTAIGGAAITVYDADGEVIATGIANPDGSYSVALAPPRIDGEIVRVTQTEADGDISPPATAVAPDLTAPIAPTAALDVTGTVVTGTGEAGATITVRAADGTPLGTAIVDAGGFYAATLGSPQTNGEVLSVTQADVAGNVSPPANVAASDITAPAAPVVTVSDDGTQVTGTGEPGATVSIIGPDGATIATAIVAADASYSATLAPAQANGELLEAIQVDAAGNASLPTLVTAPDITAPAAPTLAITLDGAAATGTGEPGATVTVRNPDGSTIGTAVVADDGTYTLALDPARIDGELLSAVQNDPAGNASPPVTAAAPDFDAPVGLTADVSDDGTTVTGAGQIGATVTIRDPDGLAIGTAVVGPDGNYIAALAPAQTNGEVLSATQVDSSGNAGLPVSATAPDLTAPALPTADVNDTGTAVTGTGEAGATVTVTAPGGAVVATAIVGADGAYTATLTPAQVNGETLSVVQADPTGNPSPAATALAPDLTAPVAPTIAINDDGTVVSGTGEPGATLTITGPDGTPIGTVPVAGDGTYTITLGDPQINGETLTATQTDPTGNVSGPASTIAPDFTTPLAPTALVSDDGRVVTGTGEAGARIVVTNPAGAVIGVATIAADGTYSATLGTPQLNGEVLSATQTDGGGNISPPVTATAPDLTAPAIPTLVIADDGASASGTGEPGATVTLVGPGGVTIGSIAVEPDGTYTTDLDPPSLNGEAFTATQADAEGNVSPPVSAVAPDITAPAAPAATIDANGTIVTGTGEAGATVSVSGPNGLVGTAVVGADNTFTVPLSPAQANGQALTVIQIDPAGNDSLPTGILAPDITAPTAPTAIVAADGTSVSGTGEPGAFLTITAPGGDTIGSVTVGADGTYRAPLTPAQADGELLSVRQADAANNVSEPSSVLAPDITAPAAPTAVVSANGGFVTGTGEPGATVQVTGPDGLLGTAIVAPGGSYAVALSAPQTDSQSLTVTQTDRANNTSLPTTVVAPDDTAPFSPTATVSAEGDAVVGTGVAGAAITVRGPAGDVIGTAEVGVDGTYTALLDIAQRNGEVLSVVQSDGVGNESPPVPAIAPDLTAPAAPSIDVGAGGDIVTGLGEPGATVTITRDGVAIGTAVVGSNGSYQVTLAEPQRNGETLEATQRDDAGNVSDPATAVAPDLTAPDAPTALLITGDGTTVTGIGEPGARVDVRGTGGASLGNGLVDADGNFTVTLVPAQVSGVTLAVTQTDAAGNPSLPGTVIAPFDIDAFDNSNTASIDLVPATSAVDFGSAAYVALVALGVVDLQAEVLSVPDVRFTVEDGHSLDAVFTYNALLDIGAASGYSVVVQRFDGTNWVAVDGPGNASLLDIRLLDDNLVATETLGPGEYRAFLTFAGAAGVGLLGSLAVAGVDADFTAVAGVVPAAVSGNVIADPGAGGAVDIVGPGTQVDSVTVNGVPTAVTANGTVVDGAWGTLVINLDGSYTYTPDTNALAIGETDTFTYTLRDPTDGELESATLSIAIGSPDITGAPVAAADVAVAAVTYDNVVTTTAPTTAFSFNSSGPLGLLSTGAGGSAFTVAANTVSDISITAVRAPGLSVLPNYTLTVRNAAGAVVEQVTQIAVVGLPIGTGTVFTVEDLPAGRYTYTISSSAAAGSFATTVSVGATTTFLDQFTLGSVATAEGNLLDNDTANTSFAGIRVDSGTGFTEIGDTEVVLTGQHGTLTIDETGDYLYRPSATLGYSAVDLFDTFTYQLVQPDGTVATSTLTVTIDVPADGTAAAIFASQAAGSEIDVIALDAFLAPGLDADASVAVADDGSAIGRAIYEVFEGQGELESVLANYLPPEETTALDGVGDAGHPSFAVDVAMPAVVDPLDYIVAPEDPDRFGTNANSVF
ncbi:BapA/Bap/LapF family large adhesin [Sphingomonas faeni]|uniref:BapA/Bap/LapF family large adhesin n=1 Tax=Sphingomonas faeni TaxID=185950 RepID=UPI003360E6AB